MAQTIKDVMTTGPVVIPATASIFDAAREMRDHDIGDVLVERDGTLCGIVSDRDIVVRALAEGLEASAARIGDICSEQLVTVSPGDGVDHAIELMRDGAVRRLPVCEDGQPVGMVSLGDLAIARDSASLLGEISAAPPND